MTYVDQLIRAVHDSCRHNTPQHIYQCHDFADARDEIDAAWLELNLHLDRFDAVDTDWEMDGDTMIVHGWTDDDARTITIHLHRGGRNASL